jgi:phosphopantothenoylcysteine decarboxylase/phosphopantothenate--cysteine ligase
MHAAVMRVAPTADAIIMAAAVADYTPASPASTKIAKGGGPLTLTLTRTPDILAELGAMRARTKTRPWLVGFAAETDNVREKARDKRTRKRLDLIVANDVSQPDQGFDVETNAVVIVGDDEELMVPLQSKEGVAAAILDRLETLMHAPAPA